MRKIGIKEIEDIATGAALLGAGGGGDPYVGKLMAIGAVRDCGPVTLLDPDEVPDDALVVPIAMMGAPTVLAEKAVGGTEYQKLFDMVSNFFGKKIYAFMPIEAGGVNSMLPVAAGAPTNKPMCAGGGMGGGPLRQSGTETRYPWGNHQPGEVRDTSCAAFRCRSPGSSGKPGALHCRGGYQPPAAPWPGRS